MNLHGARSQQRGDRDARARRLPMKTSFNLSLRSELHEDLTGHEIDLRRKNGSGQRTDRDNLDAGRTSSTKTAGKLVKNKLI
jgi:hypothetical protein